MKYEMNVPRTSYTMEAAVFEEIYVKNGDHVEKGQKIAHVIVDKADLEFTAEQSGYIKFLCEEQDEVKVNEIYAVIADTPEELEA